ncbi:MAG: 16S rRNA (cytosine(967)-C(5))-methyltransferase RsmB [Gemmatimonadota bacterium]|nr:16S rRNA (cytosine(967)-C(5))-methyltransferase RsmB [Gemmatimonadota bacterium]
MNDRPRGATGSPGKGRSGAGRRPAASRPAPGAGVAPRLAAFQILKAVQQGEAFDLALNAAVTSLPEADRRLAHELAAGVFRQRNELDARLQQLVHRGWSTVDNDLRDILRIGAYQLVILDRVPAHAAVDTTVELARIVIGESAARFTNAILRSVGGRAAAPARELHPGPHLADRYSHPLWLVERWLARFGVEGTTGLLEWNNQRPHLILQPARDTLEELQTRCWTGGVGVRRAPFDAGLVVEGHHPVDLPGYTEGAFFVQDASQALVIRFAAVPPGSLVFDACAAPGGKTLALGRLARCVLAGELKPERAIRLQENIRRAGSGREHVVVASASAPPIQQADVVLLDAPCLGTGTLARHPDARWRTSPEGLAQVVRRQAFLLNALAPAVRPGGWLVYSTCSLESEENEAQVDQFLMTHPEFHRDPAPGVLEALRTPAGDLLLLPQRDGVDGAFAARLRRQP